ncbi:DUF624 domain-containing protein [[Actinomadura] parvosata]|uniref:DUF624 domain-containing protein n=1 Tax=[Actinomadura] parvosata TaxID=1955412 RepID=UPI00406CFDBA
MIRIPTISQRTFDAIFGYIYTGLAVNLSLLLANAPLAAALLLTRDPLASWPFLLLLSPTIAPALTAAFASFRTLADGSAAPFAAFWRGWLRTFRPAGIVGGALAALAIVVALDLVWLAGTAYGALLAPILLTVLAAALATGLTVLVGIAERPDANLATVARASLYPAVRNAPLSLLSLAALITAAAAVLAQPVLGALLAVSPLLYLAYANTKVTLARTGLPAEGRPGDKSLLGHQVKAGNHAHEPAIDAPLPWLDRAGGASVPA